MSDPRKNPIVDQITIENKGYDGEDNRNVTVTIVPKSSATAEEYRDMISFIEREGERAKEAVRKTSPKLKDVAYNTGLNEGPGGAPGAQEDRWYEFDLHTDKLTTRSPEGIVVGYVLNRLLQEGYVEAKDLAKPTNTVFDITTLPIVSDTLSQQLVPRELQPRLRGA